MTERELSEKLCKLACELVELVGSDMGSDAKRIVTLIAGELHTLSNEKYTQPGTWDSIKPKPSKPAKTSTFTNRSGRKLPF